MTMPMTNSNASPPTIPFQARNTSATIIPPVNARRIAVSFVCHPASTSVSRVSNLCLVSMSFRYRLAKGISLARSWLTSSGVRHGFPAIVRV